MQTNAIKITAASLALAYALAFAPASHAHSGQVALAYPVQGLAIDGDLSDWPDYLPRYPIARREFGVAPDDTLDHRAYFRVAYDSTAQAIYAAFEVWDQSAVIDSTEKADWSNADCSELYVHIDHGDDLAAVHQYEMAGARLAIGDPRHAQVRMRHRGGYRTYEWRLDAAGALRAGTALRPGQVLGIDPVVIDNDADGSSSWVAWSRGARKFDSKDRVGDIVLMGARAKAAELRIACTWSDGGDGVARTRLIVEDSAGRRVDVDTDELGQAQLTLPAGRYRVRARADRLAGRELTVDLAAGGREQVQLVFAPATGDRVAAGPGVRTAAGAGVRIGAWHNFGPVDGLPHASINALFQDRRGFLWIGTEGGLVRYDGQDFLHLTEADGLPFDHITNMAEDRRGNLWIATRRGVARYDGRTFTRFTRADGLPTEFVTSIIEYDDEIWLGSPLGLTRYDGRRFETLTAADGVVSSHITQFVRDPQDVLWIGADGGLSRYEDGRFKNTWVGDVVQGMVPAIDGGLWYSVTGGVRKHRDGRVERLQVPGLEAIRTEKLTLDQDGNLWIIQVGSLKRYDGNAIEVFGLADGLPHDLAAALLIDRENNLWVGSYGGLSRYDGRSFVYFAGEQGLEERNIEVLVEDRDGRVLAGTGRGLSAFDGHAWTDIELEEEFAGQPVFDILRDRRGGLWLARAGGVSHRAAGKWTHYGHPPGTLNSVIEDLLEDRQGRIWFASWNGLSIYDGGKFTRLSVIDGLSSRFVYCLLEDRNGHIWFGTADGLDRYDGHGFVSYGVEEGLYTDYVDAVDALFEDSRGRIWVGTSAGVKIVEDGVMRALPPSTGIGNTRIQDFAEDEKGRIWIGTANGVLVYDGAVVQNLLRRDGLATPQVRALMLDDRGRVWIGSGGGGVTVYTPQDTAPNIALRDVVTNSRLGPVDAVELPTSQPLLAFEFLGLSFKTRPDALVYRYRLRGHEDWQTTRSRRVEYRDLPRGDYAFEVQAVDRDLNYSEETLDVAVRVHPPYRQMALYATLGLAGLLLLASVGRILRSRRELERRVEERTTELAQATEEAENAKEEAEIAQAEAEQANQAKSVFLANMSHEIRTPLNAILGYAQVLRLRRDLGSDLKTALDVIDQGGMHLLDLINSVLDLSKIEAARTELEEIHFDLGVLVQGLDAMFGGLCQRKGLEWRLQWRRGDQPLAEAPPALGVRGDEGKLRQVLVNLLGNAVKFTDAGRVELAVTLPAAEAGAYGFSVADTGRGIAADQQQAIFEPFTRVKEETRVGGTGLGLAIAQRYVALMGGRLEVASALGQGARFDFALDLAAGETVARSAAITRPRATAGHLKALVAEDVEAIQGFMRELLQATGMAVEIVGDGQAAVDRVLADRPDLVFMDIWMPVLDGQAAARRIAEVLGDARPKLVAVTASVLEHERARYRVDFDEVLLKPVRAEQIYAVIERLLSIDLEREEAPVATDDYGGLVLPAELYRPLREAVEYGMVTSLKGHLAAVEALGTEGAALAARLDALIKRFATDEILRILDEVEPSDG